MYYEQLMQVTGMSKQAGMKKQAFLDDILKAAIPASVVLAALPAIAGLSAKAYPKRSELYERAVQEGKTGFLHGLADYSAAMRYGLGESIKHPWDTVKTGFKSLFDGGNSIMAAQREAVERVRDEYKNKRSGREDDEQVKKATYVDDGTAPTVGATPTDEKDPEKKKKGTNWGKVILGSLLGVGGAVGLGYIGKNIYDAYKEDQLNKYMYNSYYKRIGDPDIAQLVANAMSARDTRMRDQFVKLLRSQLKVLSPEVAANVQSALNTIESLPR